MLSLCQIFFPFHLKNNAYHQSLRGEDHRLFTEYPKVLSTNICKTLGELCTRAGANRAKFLTVVAHMEKAGSTPEAIHILIFFSKTY